MAKFDIQELNYITAGKSQNTFNITYKYTEDGMIQLKEKQAPEGLSVSRTHTFFGDIGEYDTMSDNYNSNKQSFYDMTNNILVHNLYSNERIKTKTTAKQHNSIGQYQDIYVPHISNDFIHMCQFKSNAYGLTREYTYNPLTLRTVNNNYIENDTSYHTQLSTCHFHTYLYPTPKDIYAACSTYTEVIDNNDDLSNQLISSIFCPNVDLCGMHHNYIVEIPENGKFIDYLNGHLIGDTIVAKNHLDYTYTLSVDDSYNISGCREYCNIDQCGGRLYMTYRNTVNYRSISSNVVTYYDNVNDDLDLSIAQYAIERQPTYYNYQHVEVIDSWNRFDGDVNTGHKSSMFSIRLVDTGLNESTIPDEAKKKLRENVEHNVRQIIDNLIPAHTQLFKVYFDGK